MNIKNITKETVISTALIILALVNQILTILGYSPLPIDDAFVTNAISIIFLIGTTLYSWWHNNSITTAAQLGDKVVKAIKTGKLNEDNLKTIIDFIESSEAVKITIEEKGEDENV